MIKCENACPRGKFDGCCHKCPEFHTCPDSCQENPNACGEATFDEETALQEFKNTQLATLNAIASLTAHKKAIEDQEKEMKAKLYAETLKLREHYLMEQADDGWLARKKLKDIGCDIEEWYREEGGKTDA